MEISKRNKKLSRSIPEDVEYDLTEKRRRTDGEMEILRYKKLIRSFSEGVKHDKRRIYGGNEMSRRHKTLHSRFSEYDLTDKRRRRTVWCGKTTESGSKNHCKCLETRITRDDVDSRDNALGRKQPYESESSNECSDDDSDKYWTEIKTQLFRIEGILHEQDRKMDKIIKMLQDHMSTEQEREQLPNNDMEDQSESKFTTETGMHLLQIPAKNPSKYALKVMDVIFTETELQNHVFISSGCASKPGLPSSKVQFLQDVVKKKFGLQTFLQNESEITLKCNQKCRDKAKKIRKQQVTVDSTH